VFQSCQKDVYRVIYGVWVFNFVREAATDACVPKE